MFGRATITLGVGPHSSSLILLHDSRLFTGILLCSVSAEQRNSLELCVDGCRLKLELSSMPS